MLVTFKTSSYADITMFGEAAVSLLKLMGQSGNVPGALLAADLPDALKTLHDGLDKLRAEGGESVSSDISKHDDDDASPPVALHTRAGPLISLLESAIAANENVQWDS
ncbi:MAG: DUF1840 domain-containing protein [Granulosicoccus sp.]